MHDWILAPSLYDKYGDQPPNNNFTKEVRLVYFKSASPSTAEKNLLEGIDKKEGKEPNKQEQDIDKLRHSTLVALDKAGTAISQKQKETLLNRIQANSSTTQLKEIQTEIDNRRKNVGQFIKELSPHRGLFTQDENQGTTFEKHVEKFVNSDLENQANYLRDLAKNIKNYQEQFNQFYKLFSKLKTVPADLEKEFKDLGFENRASWLKERNTLKERANNLKKLPVWSKINKQEHEKFSNLFRILGNSALELQLNKLEVSLQKNAILYEEHSIAVELEASGQYKLPAYLKNFTELEDDEKRTALNRFRSELSKIVRSELYKHEDKFGKPDYEFIDTWLPKDSLTDTIAHFKGIKKYIADLEKAHEAGKKYDKAVLDHFDFDNLYVGQRLSLATSGKLDKYSNQEHIKADKNYQKRLKEFADKEKYPPFGLINSKGVKSYQSWFNKLSLNEKQDYLKNPDNDDLVKTKEARIANNEQFNDLPKPIQKEYGLNFKEGGFEERSKMLNHITPQIKKLNANYGSKVDAALEEGKITPQAAEQYKDWFNNDLTLKQKKIYLAESDLDDQRRDEVINIFEQEIKENPKFQELSAKKQKDYEEEFYESRDLDGKFALIKEIASDHFDESAKSLIENNLNTIQSNKAEINEELLTTKEIDKLENKADLALTDNKFETAQEAYKAILDLIDKNSDPKKYRFYQQKLDGIQQKERAFHDVESEPKIEAELDDLIDESIENPNLDSERKSFTILYLIEEGIELSEQQTLGLTAEDRQQRALAKKDKEPTIKPYQPTADELQDPLQELNQAIQNPDYDSDRLDPGLTRETSKIVEFDAVHFNNVASGAQPDAEHIRQHNALNNQFVKHQSQPLEKRALHNFKTVDHKTGEELRAKKFHEKYVHPERLQLQSKILNDIKQNLEKRYPNQPTLVQKLLDRAEKKLNSRTDQELTTKLVRV